MERVINGDFPRFNNVTFWREVRVRLAGPRPSNPPEVPPDKAVRTAGSIDSYDVAGIGRVWPMRANALTGTALAIRTLKKVSGRDSLFKKAALALDIDLNERQRTH